MPAELIRPTMPMMPTTPPPPEADGEPAGELAEADGQGRGEPDGNPKKAVRRRPRPAAGEKSAAHKLTLRDSVFKRLELHAIKRGSTASAVAEEILDRQLPRHRIVTDD
jgi:hypothetical protein